ncbi:serine/threonine-protein kinase Nek4 [Trichomycterus rosablanca]|uniref:serine/threonine-protein kinase Nek4 n=1 Tax=Trichomycterus rosablanca TaxID=2290929 RepID=UPI002F360BBE
MGFCEGGDLYHRLKQQKGELLPERQVVEWFVQIAMALQYLHEKHILHRDLKTQNIFLTKTNIIKVGDLGIARVLENQNDMASTLIGTPYYMSPELFSNKPYNYKSDVWALGCCVYEMATLKHAFNAKDMNSLVYRIIEGKLPQMPGKYDPQLGELIKRMLCKKPDDRPDVKHILRQPYIKQQITVFLEATKEKTAKSRKKVNSRPNVGVPDLLVHQKQEDPPNCVSVEAKPRRKKSEENSNQHKLHNGIKDNILTLDTPLPPKSPNQDIQPSTGQSIATISNINFDLQCQEPKDKHRKAKPPRPAPSPTKRREKDDIAAPQPHPRNQVSGVHREEVRQNPREKLESQKGSKDLIVNMAVEEDTLKLLQQAAIEDVKTEDQVTTEDKEDRKTVDVLAECHTGDRGKSLDSTDKLLEPFIPVIPEEPHNPPSSPDLDAPVLQHSKPPFHPASSSSEPSMSRQRRQRKKDSVQDESKANLRPLPPLPKNLSLKIKEKAEGGADVAKHPTLAPSVTSPADESAPQNRPLSARERRRLRQSRENHSETAAPAVRRASCDVASLGAKQADQPDCPRPASVAAVPHKERKSSWRQSDEEECSSSTSSTERSEGEYREGKSETCEMQDLVQMMTQTLRMDAKDVLGEQEGSRCNSSLLPEFKLNKKYRDTLVLHGKTREGAGDFRLSSVLSDDSSGPAKVRRAVEHLRTDVVKGLGVKLLDKVLDIMQEEDEDKREVLLRQQMGEEKYKMYAVMVRQLKFFEDVAFKD